MGGGWDVGTIVDGNMSPYNKSYNDIMTEKVKYGLGGYMFCIHF